MKRLLCCVLVMLLLLSVFASCKGNGDDNTVTTAPPAATTPPAGDQKPTLEGYQVPLTDFNHEEFMILRTWGRRWQFLDDWTANGEILNNGLLERNMWVENSMNCVLAYTEIDGTNADEWSANMHTFLTSEMQSQAGEYDMVVADYLWGLETNGYFKNLLSDEMSSHLAWEMPFYYQGWNDMAAIEDCLVGAVGSGSLEIIRWATTVIYNKSMYQNLFEGQLYERVYSGNWTLSSMLEMSKIANDDKDGQGMDKDVDTYGFAIYRESGRSMMFTMGGVFYEKDANGNINYNFSSSHNITVFEAIYDVINQNDHIYDFYITNAFNQGRVLFFVGKMDDARQLKNAQTDIDYGMVPYPKLNTQQKDYISTAMTSDYCAIPQTADDVDKSAIFLNAFQYYSHLYLRPAYYDTALKLQAAQDPESSAMLDFILDRIYLDFAFIHDENLGSVCSAFYDDLIMKQKKMFVSIYDSQKTSIETKLQEYITQYTQQNFG